MNHNIHILSTKKLLLNQKQPLLDNDFIVTDVNFIATKTITTNQQDTINEVILITSQNAVNALIENKKTPLLKNKKVFCVGLKTKKKLEEKGFIVQDYADYAENLAENIIKTYSTLSFTFFSGNLRQDILPTKLKKAGINFNEIKVYETLFTPQKNKKKTSGILFYSPSGVASYLQKNIITDEICFCIGKTTAKALKHITKNTIIAHQPSVENVIIACLNYFTHKQ